MKQSNRLNLMAALAVSVLSVTAFANETPPATTDAPATGKVKYRAGKDVNFEDMLIQGQIRRPEISVVTGNVQQGADGLLRLRENFTDRIQMDAGEEL